MGDLATLPTFQPLPTTYTHSDFNAAFANLTIASNAVSFSKFQAIAAKKLLGNPTGSSANVDEIAVADNVWSLLGAADYDAIKEQLDLEIGTDVQGYHGNLAVLAGLTLAANKLPYGDDDDSLALCDFSAAARDLLDDADAAEMRGTLELGSGAIPTFSGLIASAESGGVVKLVDSDATTDKKTAQFSMEGTDLHLRLLNDDGSSRVTAFHIDENGVFIMGNNLNFRLGTSYVNTPVSPTGYVTLQDVNGNTYRIPAVLHS